MGLEFIEGNEAIARGAMMANCNFFAGYPITPSSSVFQYMLEMVPVKGGMAVQGEDEIASMGLCLGAAMAGSKAMTATSGPGISLYSESIGLAIIGETPLVIVNVQRQGPATGSATKGDEGDIQFTRWCTSGGIPMIALSPASVEEAYELTYVAFNLAERFRVPVFVLTNKEIGLTRETVDLDAIELPSLIERAQVETGTEYRPHAFNLPGEVPLFSAFGDENIARYTTSTHDQDGYLSASPQVTQEMIDHYSAKVTDAADEIALYSEDHDKGAETLIISYGITSRSATLAARQARACGTAVSTLVLKTLFPVPETAILAAMKGIKKVIVPEMNMGQYILEIQRLAPAGIEVLGVNKMDTTLLSPSEIIEQGGLS